MTEYRMIRSCSTCRFFDVVLIHENDESDTEGEPGTICRRFPPIDGWSMVLADDWCGEWTAV